MSTKPKRSPTLLADILKKSLKNINLEEKIKVYHLWQNWQQVVGPMIAEKSSPDYILSSKLYISVESSVWLQELTFQKQNILEKIRQMPNIPKIAEIIFRVKK